MEMYTIRSARAKLSLLRERSREKNKLCKELENEYVNIGLATKNQIKSMEELDKWLLLNN